MRSYLDRTDQLNGNYNDYAKIEKLRNFEPAVLNEINMNFVDVINATDIYWHRRKVKNPKVVMHINNVAKTD